MKYLYTIILVLVLSISITTNATSEDNPEKVLKSAADVSKDLPEQISLEERWRTRLAQMNLDTGIDDGGIITIPERQIRISSASVFTKVRIGQPGWIESRVVAFEQAELEAKAKIIRSLSESTDTQRSLKHLENASWSDGSVEEIKQLGEVAETLSRLGKKSLALSEAALDSSLKKLDPDYSPEKYENKNPDELKTIAEDIFRRRIKAVAFRTLIGVTPIYTTEGNVGGEYQVLVGVIWSPKLNRVALSLMNDEYNIPPVNPGKKIVEYIPRDIGLLGYLGTRIVIDENGHYTVMAYAQAQPRRSSPSRVQAALQDAKQTAANRARAQIVNFVKEGLTLSDQEISQELSREFSDMTVGTETLRNIEHRISGRRMKLNLRGVYVVKEWSMPHPETGQNVAGAVIAWSPSSATLSKEMDETMKAQPETDEMMKTKSKPSKDEVQALESMPVDTSQY